MAPEIIQGKATQGQHVSRRHRNFNSAARGSNPMASQLAAQRLLRETTWYLCKISFWSVVAFVFIVCCLAL